MLLPTGTPVAQASDRRHAVQKAGKGVMQSRGRSQILNVEF